VAVATGFSLVSWVCPRAVSRYGRIWHHARSAAAMPGAARLRPYDLRHAALSLWLASGARPPKSRPAPGTACVSC
jgi:integrase